MFTIYGKVKFDWGVNDTKLVISKKLYSNRELAEKDIENVKAKVKESLTTKFGNDIEYIFDLEIIEFEEIVIE